MTSSGVVSRWRRQAPDFIIFGLQSFFFSAAEAEGLLVTRSGFASSSAVFFAFTSPEKKKKKIEEFYFLKEKVRVNQLCLVAEKEEDAM